LPDAQDDRVADEALDASRMPIGSLAHAPVWQAPDPSAGGCGALVLRFGPSYGAPMRRRTKKEMRRTFTVRADGRMQKRIQPRDAIHGAIGWHTDCIAGGRTVTVVPAGERLE
jgi:hypothetical protein